MRFSCLKDHPNYNPASQSAIQEITVNGQINQRVVTVDTVEGWVDAYPGNGEWNKTVRIYGAVQITYREGWNERKLLSWGEK